MYPFVNYKTYKMTVPLMDELMIVSGEIVFPSERTYQRDTMLIVLYGRQLVSPFSLTDWSLR